MKLDKKTSLKLASLSLAGLITITGLVGCKQNKKNNDSINSSITMYFDDINEENTNDFNIKLKKYNEFLWQINTLARVSSKLDKFHSKFIDIEENNEIGLLNEAEIDTIVDDYNKGYNLTRSLSILKTQYKLYNTKIYNLYEVLDDYAISMAKLYISNNFNLDDPSKITISNFYFNKVDGEYSAQVNYDNTTITLTSIPNDKDIQNILELIAISVNMDSQNETNINKIESYNKNRNNLIKNSYNRVNEIYYDMLKKDKTYTK